MPGSSELAICALSSQPIASLVRDCTRCTLPMLKYHDALSPSSGWMLMASLASGIASSIEPLQNLHSPSELYKCGQLGFAAIAASYSRIAASYRPCAHNTPALAASEKALRATPPPPSLARS